MSRREETVEQTIARRTGRWQVGCVNWSISQDEHPTVPHAVSYLAMPGYGMLLVEYHQSVADATARVDRMIREHLDRFSRKRRVFGSPDLIRREANRSWRGILVTQDMERDEQVERDNLIAVYTADGTEYDPDAVCECAMTEASHHACPVHGVNAPPEEIRH